MKTKYRILIVDDEKLILEIFHRVLERDFEIVVCRTDIEFEEKLGNGNYDLFIIDLSLGGGKDGIQLIKDLRQTEKYKKSPILVVTAHAFQRDERASIDAGATRFLRKPVENDLLLETVKELLDSK